MRATSFLVLFIAAAMLDVSHAEADSGVWGQRGISRRFVLDRGGDFLYAADGRGVAVYDVRASSAISRIDVEASDAETYDLAFMGDDLVVATSAGVERFSVRPDGTIALSGFTAATGPTALIAANARYAVAATGRTISILEPQGTSLTVVSRIPLPGAVTALAFVGDFLYVAAERQPLRVYAPPSGAVIEILPGINSDAFAFADGILWSASTADGLLAIDVGVPNRPKLVGSIGRGTLLLRGVAASGGRVVAFEAPDAVYVFDGSNPASPRLAATLEEWVNVIAASGDRTFLSGAVVTNSGLAFDPGLIPRETGTPVRIFDGLSLTAEFTDLAGPVSGAWTDGSVAYIVDPPYLRVLDVSVTTQPRQVMALPVPNIQDKIRVKNGKAIIYGRAYVNYLDVSTPLRPRVLGTWDAQGNPPSSAAILRDSVIEANEHSGMHIVNFRDPANGIQIGGRKWHYRDVAASDDAAYALMQDLMLVVEIAGDRTVVDRDLVNIQYAQVDTMPPNSSSPDSLLVRGDEGLRIYSIAGENRFSPQEVAFLPLRGLGVFGTSNGSAYVTREGRLYFLDASGLTLQETQMAVTSPMQISVAGEKIVVADRYAVRVYGPDTAPPAAGKRRAARH